MNKPKNILIVDDDKIYHFILKNLFTKNNYNISTCFTENGQEGIDLLKNRVTENSLPDIILLDINMPIMNGWQFLDELKILMIKYQFHIPVYLISSSNNHEDFKTAQLYKDQIKAFVLKPIDDVAIHTILN